MVVIFNKRIGTIKYVFSGNDQSIDVMYGDEAEDYKKILDQVIVQDDWNVINNWRMFKVNLDTKQIELLANKYPIAPN
jgi:hypothetical protein